MHQDFAHENWVESLGIIYYIIYYYILYNILYNQSHLLTNQAG
jgi:hypothetical protein